MPWPLSQDYNEVIQSPGSTFSDAELRAAESTVNALGIPQPRSGNFADVYEMRSSTGRWAVKCFTRQVSGLRERYAAISRHLRDARLPFIVDFTFLEQGIRVRGQWFPVVKMQWVEGLTLNEFVRQYADKPAMLNSLLQIWLRMASRLREAGIAHADLQHGNVILVPGTTANSLAVKLVDYDGTWVPALADKKSGEVGHPNYQHPQRLKEGTYNGEVDRFPLLLVATALDCLRVGGKALWDKYDSGDNLLFREADLQAPSKSALFLDLLKLTDERAARLVRQTLDSLRGRLEAVPLLEGLLPDLHAVPSPRPATKGRTVTNAAAQPAPGPPPELAPAGSRWDFDRSGDRGGRRPQRRGAPGWGWLAGGAAAVIVAVVVGLAVRNGSKPTPPDGLPVAPKGVVRNGSRPKTPDGPPGAAKGPGGDDRPKDTDKPKDAEANRKKDKTDTPEKPARYALTDLGTSLEDHDGSYATAINSAGRVVVNGYKQVEKSEKIYRTLVYDGKSFKDIGTLGGRSTVGIAINDAGWVAGMSYLKGGSTFRAFLHDGRIMKNLGTLEGGTGSDATGINEHGHVVGSSTDATGKSHGFLHDGKVMRDIGTLGTHCNPLAITNTDLVVGHSAMRNTTGGYSGRAFLYDGIKMQNLGTLRGDDGGVSAGNAINSSGQIVGNTTTSSGQIQAFIYQGGRMRELSLPRWLRSSAQSINSAGQVVGDASIRVGQGFAFLYEDGKLSDLNDLIPAGSGWVLTSAAGINDRGQIAGSALYKGKRRAFLLTPNVKPSRPLPKSFKNTLGMEFVRIPKGKSWLGGGKGKPGDKEVVIPHDYYLGRYLVTQQEWQNVMGNNPSWFSRSGPGKDAVKGISDTDLKRFPVENVSWNDAQVFLAKLNKRAKESGWAYRLPTDVEWEYACRGGPLTDKTASAFHYYLDKPTNGLLPEQANFYRDGGLKRTCKVGSYAPNPLGLYDMHGNVWEWCHDAQVNRESLRILRGGSHTATVEGCVASNRPDRPPANRNPDAGLRLARVPAGAEKNRRELEELQGQLAPIGDAETAKLRAAIHKGVNKLRAEKKLTPLVRNAKLDAAAQKHAENMARQEKLALELDGKTLRGTNTMRYLA